MSQVDSIVPVKPSPPPETMCWHGVEFDVDLPACRQAIVEHLLTEGTQLQDLASAAGVSRMSLWRFMNGKKPSIQTVHKILRALDISPRSVISVARRVAALLPF